MWNDLPSVQKDAYKRLILAFASLTEMFVYSLRISVTK